MKNIEIHADVSFSFINISSISAFTIVRVGRFGEISSLMDGCFDMSTSNIEIQRYKYTAILTLTTACYNDIIAAVSYSI